MKPSRRSTGRIALLCLFAFVLVAGMVVTASAQMIDNPPRSIDPGTEETSTAGPLLPLPLPWFELMALVTLVGLIGLRTTWTVNL